MERFALLIESSDVKGQGLDDLPGAREDIKNWRNFLTSKLGGNWIYSDNETVSEIVIRRKPLSTEVKNLLEQNKHKYCFVAFAGHGFHDPRLGDFVCLNDYNVECHLTILKPKSSKGTLVVDACRGYEKAHISTSFEKSAEQQQHLIIANEAAIGLSRKSELMSFSSYYHNPWSDLLKGSPDGTVTMLSCAKGQSAGDIKVEDKEVGGIYTTLLMRSAQYWEKNNYTSSLYTTKEAHDDAATYMRANFKKQSPEYSPLHLQYPFAVK